jgi:hypothetical protein
MEIGGLPGTRRAWPSWRAPGPSMVTLPVEGRAAVVLPVAAPFQSLKFR